MDPIWPAKATRAINGTPFLNYEGATNEFAMYLGRFDREDELEVIVRKKQKKSSNAQNSYYYGVIVKIISDHTGHSLDEIDSILKWKFLRQTDEKGMDFVPSKMDLTTKTREQFHEDCRRWGAVVLGLSIPLPNEVAGE